MKGGDKGPQKGLIGIGPQNEITKISLVYIYIKEEK
ncbi:hypothetical protein ES703_35227 [subsurface metagenome]